jgi:hypothetical protein
LREGNWFPHNAFTPERRVRFCDALAVAGNVRAACAQVGVSAEAAYKARRRDPLFARAWDAALVLARRHAEAVLADRALNGVEEQVFYRGEEVARRRRFDARLLLAHLERLDRRCGGRLEELAEDRFDEMLAAMIGPVPGADELCPVRVAQLPEEGLEALAPPRRAYVAARIREAEYEAEEQVEAAGGWDERGPDPVFVAGEEARIAAGEEWDAAREAAHALVDALVREGEEEPPFEVKGGEFAQGSVNCVNLRSARRAKASFRRRGAGVRLEGSRAAPQGGRRASEENAMKKSLFLAAMLAGSALAAPASAQMAAMDMPAAAPAADPAAAAAPAAPAEDKKKPTKGMFMATLAGANETAPGDADGSGKFHATGDAEAGEFCFSLQVSGIGDVTGAHVHEGGAGKDGKVVMTVYETDAGEEECLAPAPELIAKMLENPEKFYVNVHTAEYPKGAVRAQLSLGQ